MTLFQIVKTTLISVLNKITGSNKSSYSPEYVRSQNQPNNKVNQILNRAKTSQKPL